MDRMLAYTYVKIQQTRLVPFVQLYLKIPDISTFKWNFQPCMLLHCDETGLKRCRLRNYRKIAF